MAIGGNAYIALMACVDSPGGGVYTEPERML